MTGRLQIMLIIGSLLFMLFTLYMLRKEKLELRYSLLWFVTAVAAIAVAIKPEILILLSQMIGVEMPSNLVFAMAIFFLLIIEFSLSLALSRLGARQRELTQQVGLLENALRTRMDELERRGK